MNTKLLVLGITGLVTASCGVMPGRALTAPGPITVTVEEISGAAIKCNIKAPGKHDYVKVPPGTYTLTWNLDGPANYRFDPRIGITFPTSGSPIFTNPVVTARTFSYTDNNTGQLGGGVNSHGAFPYHINVESTGTPAVKCKLDPTVINDDGSSNY